mgnify:CR=1 FL=1
MSAAKSQILGPVWWVHLWPDRDHSGLCLELLKHNGLEAMTS